ncbi:MAG: hypothetical protein OEZ10_11720 [Gammaproteobacteria bacterium]|nr:hypothetical protein [Gammaproteobacteria bacterium]
MTEIRTKETPPIDSTDAAWVTIRSDLPADKVFAILSDVEVLLRINPYYYFESLSVADNSYTMQLTNHSNQQNTQTSFTCTHGENRLELVYRDFIKKRTVLEVKADNTGCVITLSDDYSNLSEPEREKRVDEVDKSLNAWGEAILTYLSRIKRWSWLPGWRTYMRRFWIPMKPSARRIVWMLYLVTVVEFFFFLFVMLIYVLEQMKPDIF